MPCEKLQNYFKADKIQGNSSVENSFKRKEEEFE